MSSDLLQSKSSISKTFDQISKRYDFVNRVLSFGMDLSWRKKLSKLIPQKKEVHLLDLATGTCDQLICNFESAPQIKRALGIDLSENMLKIGREKIRLKPYENKIELEKASALQIPTPDRQFDCVTMSFGIRNVEDVLGCLKEIYRVLKPAGVVLILEFSQPTNKMLRPMHLFYLRKILPYLGGYIAKNRNAYSYLNQSIETFPFGDRFSQLLKEAGFSKTTHIPLTFGVVTIYKGERFD